MYVCIFRCILKTNTIHSSRSCAPYFLLTTMMAPSVAITEITVGAISKTMYAIHPFSLCKVYTLQHILVCHMVLITDFFDIYIHSKHDKTVKKWVPLVRS